MLVFDSGKHRYILYPVFNFSEEPTIYQLGHLSQESGQTNHIERLKNTLRQRISS